MDTIRGSQYPVAVGVCDTIGGQKRRLTHYRERTALIWCVFWPREGSFEMERRVIDEIDANAGGFIALAV